MNRARTLRVNHVKATILYAAQAVWGKNLDAPECPFELERSSKSTRAVGKDMENEASEVNGTCDSNGSPVGMCTAGKLSTPEGGACDVGFEQ